MRGWGTSGAVSLPSILVESGADAKISAMPAAAALGAADLIAMVQAGANVKGTPAQVLTYIQNTLALTKNNATNANPTDASDSASGYSAGSTWLNTTSMAYWICRDASVGAAVWDRISFAGFSSFVSGRFYAAMPGTIGTAPGGTITDGTQTMQPFYVRETVTINQIGGFIDTGSNASALWQMAIYANNPATCRPTGKKPAC